MRAEPADTCLLVTPQSSLQPASSASEREREELNIMTLKLATLYIILGSISFIACVLTFVVLIKKFIDRPLPHCFFSYSDTIASALLSLALLLDGIIGLVPAIVQQSCYHFKLLNGLFVVAIVTGFFSVLGISIERFHMFAVVKDYSAIRRKFSIFWFLSSWTLSIVFVIILLPQIQASLQKKKSWNPFIFLSTIFV